MRLFGKKKMPEEKLKELKEKGMTASRDGNYGKAMKILLAEDDFSSRRALSRLLSQYGECDVVVDGKEAVEYFVAALENNEPYDLVCLDVLIPVMDGHGVLKKIRKIESQRNIPQENQIKVIMTSKQGLNHTTKKVYGDDDEMFLIKPFDEGELQATLKELGLV